MSGLKRWLAAMVFALTSQGASAFVITGTLDMDPRHPALDNNFDINVSIAVSGIAGPGGGTEDKPVGTVHVALATRGEAIFSKRYFFPVDRISFKQRVTRLALDLLRRRLRGLPLE